MEEEVEQNGEREGGWCLFTLGREEGSRYANGEVREPPAVQQDPLRTAPPGQSQAACSGGFRDFPCAWVASEAAVEGPAARQGARLSAEEL